MTRHHDGFALDAWTPSPRHLLRVGCLADVTADWPPGDVYEVGAGTGDVTSRFVARGFKMTAYDLGEHSRDVLRRRFGPDVTVIDDPEHLGGARFDYLFAFEVLEHIADDRGALLGWLQHLRPGGRVLFSVPAHQRKYSDADRAVGHVRRYERGELEALLTGAGLIDVELHNYGFPLGNALRYTQNAVRTATGNRATTADEEDDRIARGVESGVSTASPLNRLRKLSTPALLRPFATVQRVAYGRDWSDGYVATAVRPPS
ncbi:MAG: class I SAM-dependent methyltransferase [Actinomycetota bacterium]